MRSKAISRAAVDAAVVRVAAAAYVIPTDRPESDGTFEWTSTTMVVAEVDSAEAQGIGYSYAPRAAAQVISDTLAPVVFGRDAMDVQAAWLAMRAAVRNQGLPGVCSEAISAVDAALWDLKGRLLDLPLAALLGCVRRAVPLYGSGGFTSYTVDELCHQLREWVESGLVRVKMKVGRDRRMDPERVAAARKAIGDEAELFVDANGAWTPSEAIAMAERFAQSRVTWFEEPVTSDDLHGLRRVRDHAPAGMAVAAGEYGYDLGYFRRMLEAGAVDVLQADASRCAGISGFLAAGALADAFAVPLSAHTAPLLHLAACCAVPRLAHIEYFHDHVRIERLFFDGLPPPHAGSLAPDFSQPGLGLAFKRADAAPYRVM